MYASYLIIRLVLDGWRGRGLPRPAHHPGGQHHVPARGQLRGKLIKCCIHIFIHT